jgi:hypothetical protein
MRCVTPNRARRLPRFLASRHSQPTSCCVHPAYASRRCSSMRSKSWLLRPCRPEQPMRDELIRAAVAVPVASLIGPSVSTPEQSHWRARAWWGMCASCLILLALANHLGGWQTWVVAAVAGCASAAMPVARSASGAVASDAADSQVAPSASWLTPSAARAVCLAALATAIAVLAIDRSATGDALASVTERRGLVLVLAGGLAAVFIGGEIIAHLLHPFATRIGSPVVGMENAGRVIGWLERTLLYGLVLAGAPDAAALVIAGKSIARFPSFAEESFAEYYLIGSLMSLLIAAGTAVAIRAALGLTPLPA